MFRLLGGILTRSSFKQKVTNFVQKVFGDVPRLQCWVTTCLENLEIFGEFG